MAALVGPDIRRQFRFRSDNLGKPSPSGPVSSEVLWTNLVGMLFSMSFIPFASAYLAEHIKNALPVAVYGGLFAACLTGFIALSSAIARHRLPQNEEARRRDASAARKNVVVLAAYLVAIPIAFLSTWTALAIVVVVSAFFVLPTTWPASPKP